MSTAATITDEAARTIRDLAHRGAVSVRELASIEAIFPRMHPTHDAAPIARGAERAVRELAGEMSDILRGIVGLDCRAAERILSSIDLTESERVVTAAAVGMIVSEAEGL